MIFFIYLFLAMNIARVAKLYTNKVLKFTQK